MQDPHHSLASTTHRADSACTISHSSRRSLGKAERSPNIALSSSLLNRPTQRRSFSMFGSSADAQSISWIAIGLAEEQGWLSRVLMTQVYTKSSVRFTPRQARQGKHRDSRSDHQPILRAFPSSLHPSRPLHLPRAPRLLSGDIVLLLVYLPGTVLCNPPAAEAAAAPNNQLFRLRRDARDRSASFISPANTTRRLPT